MTASAGTVEGLPVLGRPEGEPDQVDEGRAEGDARPMLVVEAKARGQHERIHLGVLAVIAATQLAWIATLIYGIWLLLP